MKKVSLLVLVSMILLLAFTSCDMLPESVAGTLENVKETVVGTFENVKDTVLGFLGIDTHEHVWNEATCESPKTCECGATDGEPLPHSWNEATCQAPKTCSVCGKTEGSALKHTWEQADCENPQTCKVCGETTGTAEGHFWIEATCETAKYCLICNKVEGEALGHDWTEGDCTTPKTCKTCSVVGAPAPGHNWVAASCTDARTCETCGETDGEALGHDWTEATCLTAKVCNRCELVEGEALGHKWLDATCETPKTCERCQLEEGEAIGHNYEATVVDPTCVNDGYTMHICANCNDTYTDTPVDALGHSWKDANCVDPKTCTVCGEIDGEALGHTWVDATCIVPKTCSVCGETEGEVTGHVGGTATCNSLKKCDVCGEGYGEYDTHSLVASGASISCTKCNATFVVETEGVYFDGTNMTGTAIGSYKDTNIGNYIGTGSAYNGGANKVVSEDGVWKAITDEDRIDGTDSAGTTQMQVWLPEIKTGFDHFNAANKSIGVLSFDIKVELSAPKDVLSFLLHNSNGWDPTNGIRTNVFDICPAFDDTGAVTGYNAHVWQDNNVVLVALPVELAEGSDASEWFAVQMFYVMDSEKDVVTTYYFINGEFLASGSYTNTVENDALSCVYINLNAWNEGTGYYIDNILFGHTTESHYVFDNREHVVTPATCTTPETCSCGHTRGEELGHDWVDATCLTAKTCKRCDLVEGDPLGHTFGSSVTEDAYIINCTTCEMSFALEEYKNFTGADKGDFVLAKNGAFDITIDENGQYAAIFKPEQDEIPAASDFEQKDGKPTGTYKGWAYYNAPGAQHMFWIPSNNPGKGLQGFDCEVNAVGVISFKIKTNVTTGYHVSIAKERNLPSGSDPETNWTGWGTGEMKLLYIGEYTDNGVVVKGGINGSTEFTTIPVADGWSEMFDVKIFIELKDDSTITLHYYINDVFYGTFSGPMTIDSLDIRALYINGWTYAANTGIILDDIVMGYTANYGSHLVFDGKDHKVTESTDCTTPTSCSCGWVGQPKAHNYSDATCTSNATCLDCGAIQGERKPHTLVYDGLNISCSVCNRSYKLEGIYADGTDVKNVAGAGNALFNIPNSNPEIVDGHYELIKTETTADPGQAQVWVPATGGKGLQGFNTANGSVEGYFNFKVNAWVTKNFEMTFVDYSLGDNYDVNGDGEKESIRWSDAWRIGNSFFRISTPIVGEDKTTVEVKGFGGIVLKTITVADAEKPFTGWIDVRLQITLDAEKDVVRVTYYVDGEMCGEGEQPLTTLTNGICAIYINGNTAPAGSGYMLDDLTFGYKADPHWTLDGKDHDVIEATCTEAKKCSCGYVLGEALGHDYKPTCTEDSACSRCGEVAKATGHSLVASGYANNAFVYGCVNGCGATYNLTGYYMDGTDATRYHENDYVNLDVVNNGADYVLNINEAGQYEMLYPHETTDTNGIKGQQQIWIPLIGNPELMYEFSCANNAVGFLSAKVNVYNNFQGFQMKLNAERGVDGVWDWSKTSFAALDITPVTADTQKTVDVKAHDGKVIKTVEIGEDKWSGWIDVAIKIELHSDNTITLTYYLDGHEVHTLTKAMPITTGRITSVYINGRTSVQNSGFKFDDLVFGYSVPTYVDGKLNTTEIAAENVQSATLKTLVNSKIKQYDQCTEVNVQGGTPVYVKAFNNNKATEALYFSRTYAWAGTEAEQFSEFRFAVNGEQPGAVVTSITFNYLAKGTVEKNERYEFTDLDGSKFYADAYVQIKTPSTHPGAGDSYPELQGTDLVLDGQWHTMSIDLGEGVEIIDILLNLYHFQGELLISDLVLTYAE